MRKLFRLFTLTAIMTLSMTAAAWAKEITQSETLTAGETYEDLVITGSDDVNNPVEITVDGDVTVKNVSSKDKNCIEIVSGYVKIIGKNNGGIYHKNDSGVSSSIIKINPGANLTLDDVTVSGTSKDKVINYLSYGDVDSIERVYFGIENQGTLNIEDGTVITNMVTPSSFKLGCAIYNSYKDTIVNIRGGVIKNSYSPGGGALTIHNGVVNMTGGAIYDTTVALYHTGGTFNITGGVVAGDLRSSTNRYGDYVAAGISGTYGEKITVKYGEETNPTEITINTPRSGSKLLACPAHKISSTVDDIEYIAIYTDNKWDFISLEHGVHKIELTPADITVQVGSIVDIKAQVICPEGHNVVSGWKYEAEGGGLGYVEAISSNNNILKLKALQPGTVTVTATTAHASECTPAIIRIIPNQTIKETVELKDKEYTDLAFDGSPNPITVNIRKEGITIKSDKAENCINIKGNVTITGGPIYFAAGNIPTRAIINVEKGATLTLNSDLIGNEAVDVYAGIYNEGNCTINGVVTDVMADVLADDDIIPEGAVINYGYVTVTGAIYGNKGYAIYDSNDADAKDITINGGMVAGMLEDNLQFYTLSGNTRKGRICCTYTDDEFEITNNHITSPKRIMVKNGEILIASKLDSDTQYLSATINGKSGIKCNIMQINDSTVRWEFLEDESSTVSFVRGKYIPSETTSPFTKSHTASSTNKEESDVIGETSTIATAFYDKMLIPNPDEEYVYILCDINVPNIDTYAKGVESGATYKDIAFSKISTITDNDGYIRVAISGTYTDKIKFKLSKNSETSEYGIIINNLYAPKATVKMRPCTEIGYNAATDYKEIDVNTSNDTAEVNF